MSDSVSIDLMIAKAVVLHTIPHPSVVGQFGVNEVPENPTFRADHDDKLKLHAD
jgi:hypothetical protein